MWDKSKIGKWAPGIWELLARKEVSDSLRVAIIAHISDNIRGSSATPFLSVIFHDGFPKFKLLKLTEMCYNIVYIM